jgi:hypothetical protein
MIVHEVNERHSREALCFVPFYEERKVPRLRSLAAGCAARDDTDRLNLTEVISNELLPLWPPGR